MKIEFLSLGSGSSGNCYFLGTSTYGILIDAGVGVRTIKKILKTIQRPIESIHGIFVTHDHADHIKAVGNLAFKHNIPIYTTKKIHEGMSKSYCMTQKLAPDVVKYLEKGCPMQLKDFKIVNFEVPHDGTDNVGYSITIDNKNFAFLTDMGEITPVSSPYILKANYLIIESNYDQEMLRMGHYPAYLKQRVMSKHGHMCNEDTARFLAKNYRTNWKHIWLCHLSKDNNHPELAYKTVEQALLQKNIEIGKDLELTALKRTSPSEQYFFE